MNEKEELFHAIGSAIVCAEKGQLFGKPCFKVEGKAFTCFFQDQMVFKLDPENHKLAMSMPAAKLFDPSGKGRPMKEWVQVPFEASEHWMELAESAFQFVKK